MDKTNSERIENIRKRGLINLPRSEELWLLDLVEKLMNEHYCDGEQVKLWGDGNGTWGHCQVCDAEYDSPDEIPPRNNIRELHALQNQETTP